MYDNNVHSVPDRIVSQPFIRPIVRGKAGKPVEFGAKRFYEREGHYPKRILADKGTTE